MLKALATLVMALFFVSTIPATTTDSLQDTEVPQVHLVSTTDQDIIRYDWNRTGVATASSNIVDPHVRWTYTVQGILATGPMALDVDGDGKKEIFIGEIRNDDNQRLMYSLDSNGGLRWTYPGKYDLGPYALADLDGDGVPEVVYEEGAHQPEGGLDIYVLNAVTGLKIWNYTDHRIYWEEGFSTSPIVYDVNGDGISDLTLGSFDRFVYTFDGKDGTVLWKSPAFEHYIRASSPFTDLDGDGEMDLVIWDNHAIARAYSIKTHKLLWEQVLGYGVASTPAIGDLDGDDSPEIVFSLVITGGVQVLNADGSLLWINTNWTYFYHSPTLIDVDGDGLLDIVLGDSKAHTIIAYRGLDGQELWNTTLPGTTWSQAPLVSADIDGDGVLEILAGSDSGLFSLESTTGAINWFFPVFKVRTEPRVTDIDGDGYAEIMFGAGDGKLYVIDQAPEPRFEPRTIGYWKHQCNVEAPKGDHVGMQQSFIDMIRSQSSVFSSLMTVDEACTILWANYKHDMGGRAKQQLLALWLNIVSGFVDPPAKIDLPSLTTAKTVGDAILDTENLILTYTDKPSLVRAKDICDAINNGRR